VNRVLGAELIDNVLAVRKSNGTSFLIIEHDMDIVMTVSDRVIVMHEGRVIADGSPEAVQRDAAVAAAYLGSPTTTAPQAPQATQTTPDQVQQVGDHGHQ